MSNENLLIELNLTLAKPNPTDSDLARVYEIEQILSERCQ